GDEDALQAKARAALRADAHAVQPVRGLARPRDDRILEIEGSLRDHHALRLALIDERPPDDRLRRAHEQASASIPRRAGRSIAAAADHDVAGEKDAVDIDEHGD